MIENHSSEDNTLAHHLPSTAEDEDNDMEEHFPTVSLDDDFWLEEPVQRGTCAYMKMHNMICALIHAHMI